jgi:hypothetical protein
MSILIKIAIWQGKLKREIVGEVGKSSGGKEPWCR